MSLSFKFESQGEKDVISFIGSINEDAEVSLADLVGKMDEHKEVTFNLKKVETVNSCGVRAWINFLREAEKKSKITFEDCTPEIVSQMNMIPNFKGNSFVKSVIGVYICENCDTKKEEIFISGQNMPKSSTDEMPEIKCPKCAEKMEMEELEEEFFAWVDAG